MNWYLFICYVTISLQVLSFIVVITIAGPQEDGTWTRKSHSDWRAAERGLLEDGIIGHRKTEVDPNQANTSVSEHERWENIFECG